MIPGRWLVGFCAVAFACILAFITLIVIYKKQEKCFITLSEHQDVSTILPDEFLSIGIDASELESFRKIDFKNEKFRELTSALAPAHLRLGGTLSDRIIFSKEDISITTCDECAYIKSSKHTCNAVRKLCKHKLPFIILTGSKWSEVNEFCKATNMKLLFPLNLLLRNSNGWNNQNAKDLLLYTKLNKFKLDWQLGNEPNSLKHIFNIEITPLQLAHDFKKLRNLLDEHGFNDSLLVGPDTTRPQQNRPECLSYMVEFLGNGSKFINVRSWHQYYLNSRTVKLEDFWNVSTFNLLNKQISTMKSHTKQYSNIPMWLTETSSSYGGGAPGLSNSFAGTPLWVDKLGLAAKQNITTVIRQSLFGGNYSILDENYNPLPDWWVSALYKQIVGKKVFHIDCYCSEQQRMYAHCSKKGYTNNTSAVTIYGVNLKMKKIKFLLNGTAFPGDNLDADEYIFSARSNNRETKEVLLNGWPLQYESSPPQFQPRPLKFGKHISMPPFSVGFWVIKNAAVKVCEY